MDLIVQSKSITNITQIFVFFAFFLCWFQTCFHYLRRYSPLAQSIPVHLQPNAVVALISTFHATVSTLLSFFILYLDKDLSEHKLLYSSFMISFTLNFSMGYLLFDLLIMSLHRAQFEWNFVIHHFVSIIAFYCCSTQGVFPYIALFRLTSEGSTPFLNIRWILLTLNKRTASSTFTTASCWCSRSPACASSPSCPTGTPSSPSSTRPNSTRSPSNTSSSASSRAYLSMCSTSSGSAR